MTVFNDAGCPWGYSANPALRVLEWRYGGQLEWRLVLIGLTNVAQEYVDRGYTPLQVGRGVCAALSPVRHAAGAESAGADRRYRPLLPGDRGGAPAGARARVGRLPGVAVRVLHDDAAARRGRGHRGSASGVDGIDVDAAIAAIDTPAVEDAYQRDRAEARTAAGSPTQLQDKHATIDGPVRYTAPSLVFEHGGRRLEAGGWQTIEAYDVIVANLIPDGERRGVPDDPRELIDRIPGRADNAGGCPTPHAWQRRPRPNRG